MLGSSLSFLYHRQLTRASTLHPFNEPSSITRISL
jgi:hypothetical protein